jgi:hypothetical protein
VANGEWRVSADWSVCFCFFLTAENTEIAESFDHGNIFTEKEKVLTRVGNKFLERLKMLPSRIFWIGRLCH